jgi:hypothetical protein
MPSKKFDLEKSLAKKTLGRLAQSGTPQRFGAASAPAPDRREQRRLDQAAGLVPFAAKLPGPLIAALNDAARAEGLSAGEWLARELPARLPKYHASTPVKEG